MIQPPRRPQLMQLVATLPRALWGVERLNLGHRGPVVRVRRTDAVEQDCYSQADIAAFCGSLDGVVSLLYDQSGNGYTAAENTATYPKIYDGATQRVTRFGRTAALSFDGIANRLRASGLGFSGSPAITTAFLTGTLGPCEVPAGQNYPWSIGYISDPVTVGTIWLGAGFNAPNRMSASYYGRNRYFTSVVDQTVAPSAVVMLKAVNASAAQLRTRQNKAELAQASVADGALVLDIGGQAVIGALTGRVTAGSAGYAAMTLAVLGHWNAVLAGQDLDGLEQVLERMRIQ